MAIQTDFLTYRLTIGLSTMEGRGFYYPSDTVIGHDHRLYVVNRSLEGVDRGIRVTMCDLDSAYYGTFGSYGEGEGQFVWPSGGAVAAGAHLVDACLEQMGALTVSDKTRGILTQCASQGHDGSAEEQARATVAHLFRLTAASPEFQRA